MASRLTRAAALFQPCAHVQVQAGCELASRLTRAAALFQPCAHVQVQAEGVRWQAGSPGQQPSSSPNMQHATLYTRPTHVQEQRRLL